MNGATPDCEQIDQAADALMRLRSRMRKKGAVTLGSRVIVVGDGMTAAIVAGALLQIGAQELTLVGRPEELAGTGARLARAHPSRRVTVAAPGESEAPWRSAHGVIDARATAEQAVPPHGHDLLPAGAWSVRCGDATAEDGLVVEATV